ncbi:hypothetical protein PPYC2_16515 [Paenibacillus polymyxa]|uniref:hypothetical protein n=1 Tax=Paenibacillus polymyxa TaxID=1406 RepID=UPI0008FB4E14|nr:hypothetical protein [Paenibacillus polymyxa]APB76466.1 hypothetical protein PPYC2_16515 [Paenibacillus polymyxa]
MNIKNWFALLGASLFLGYTIYSFQNPDTSSENVANITAAVMQKLIGVIATTANLTHIVIN